MKGLFAKYGLRETVPVLATNTAFARSLIGTPVTPALAARSLIFANSVSNGDILIAANEGGNSQAYIWVDSSAGQMNLYGSGTLALAITASAVASSLAFQPASNDGAALGASGTAWADLFLATGGVINWNAGDVTLTHAANALTVGGGDLLVADTFGVIVGHTGQLTGGAISEFQVLGTALADGSIILGVFAASALAPDFQFMKGRGATVGSLTIVNDNDEVGRLVWLPADGADLATEAAVFQAEVDDTSPAAGDIGMAFVWESMGGGGLAISEKMRLSAAGGLSVGLAGTTTGQLLLSGATSGTVTITPAATAGTWTYTLPTTAGEAGDVQVTNGSGTASWVSGMRSVDVQLTNAQLLALLGTDITLVAAPGANRSIIVHAIYLFFDVTTTAYTINAGATSIGYASDGANIAVITEAGFLDTVADDGRWYTLGGAVATPVIQTPVANAAVVMRKATADMTGGNAANTLSVRVYYSVVDHAAFT